MRSRWPAWPWSIRSRRRTYYGGEQRAQRVEDHALGLYQALIEARIPFEMVHDGLLDAAHVDQFKTLILPNIAALSDAQCEQLRQFVERGGSLIATHETSLYDEWGVRRETSAWRDSSARPSMAELEGPDAELVSDIRKDPPPASFIRWSRPGRRERIINGVTA